MPPEVTSALKRTPQAPGPTEILPSFLSSLAGAKDHSDYSI